MVVFSFGSACLALNLKVTLQLLFFFSSLVTASYKVSLYRITLLHCHQPFITSLFWGELGGIRQTLEIP